MWVDETRSFNMGDWHFHYNKQDAPQVKNKIGNLSPRVQHLSGDMVIRYS